MSDNYLNITNIYYQLLEKYSDTLEETSKDSSHEESMTKCQKNVINFDKLKESIALKYKEANADVNLPQSCDALYMSCENEWFLIEFKNGQLRGKRNEIRGKIVESLLLLTEQLNNTIAFTRNNVNFVLVYNEMMKSRNKFDQEIEVRTIKKLVKGFQCLYFKNVFVWNRSQFENQFVTEFCVKNDNC